MKQLDIEPIHLAPKEGLALVNGTSVSSAIAAIAVYESKRALDLSIWINALFGNALMACAQPFDKFVHRMKPHPGQQEVAAKMRSLLSVKRNGVSCGLNKSELVQDRYSTRCIPQYFGPIAEGLKTISHQVETEINSTDDNPLVDVEGDRILQAGNFYGQYIAIGMDQLRQYLALISKQLDAQISLLVMPEFNRGLPACLAIDSEDQGVKFGLKGLQIYLNSIIPRLLHLGNPIVSFFPTHAEQFNQNINSQSFNAAVLASESVKLLKYYLSAALIFAIQSVDLRAHQLFGTYLGHEILGSQVAELYTAFCDIVDRTPSAKCPLISNSNTVPIDQLVARVFDDLNLAQGRIFTTLATFAQPLEVL